MPAAFGASRDPQTLADAGPRLRDQVLIVGARYGLALRQLAFALAYATRRVVEDCQPTLSPAVAVTLWAEIMFATARMAPLARPV